MRKKKITVIALFALLSLLLVACTEKTDQSETSEKATESIPEFAISVCGVSISNNEMKDCELFTAVSESVNSEGTKKTAEYKGYKLTDVFKACGIEDIPKAIEVTATDGYSFKYEGDLSDATCLVALQKDGETFKEGPWFAPCSSDTTGDYLKNLKSIESADKNQDKEGKEDKEETELTELAEPDVSDKTDKITFTDYKFKVNGKDVANADLEGLKIFKAVVTVQNSKGKISEQTYSGYVLKDVLDRLGLADAKNVKAIASDGYESEISPEDLESDITLIAIEKDKATSDDGSVWLAPCAQTSSGKYVKGVVEITAN